METAEDEERILARAVIDASGTYATPNPLGSAGVPAAGERPRRGRVTYGIPDVLGEQRARFAGRRVLVVGSGHSAFNALRDLIELQAGRARHPRRLGGPPTGAGRRLRRGRERPARRAPATGRGAPGTRRARRVEVVTGFATERLHEADGGIVASGGGREIGPVEELIAVTGYRPDLELVSELRLGLDPAVESPSALAPLIDPNVHSCGSVPPHGERELAHPEPGFYMVGMKSYGRAPTFLLRTGYEQVRSWSPRWRATARRRTGWSWCCPRRASARSTASRP